MLTFLESTLKVDLETINLSSVWFGVGCNIGWVTSEYAFESSGEIPFALADRNICRILLRGSSYFVVATMNMQLMNFRIRIILY